MSDATRDRLYDAVAAHLAGDADRDEVETCALARLTPVPVMTTWPPPLRRTRVTARRRMRSPHTGWLPGSPMGGRSQRQ